MTLAGGLGLVAGPTALALAIFLAAWAPSPSFDPLIWLTALGALTIGTLFLVWGTRALVASGLVTVDTELSRPLRALLGLLLACLAVYLALAAFALIALSVFAEGGFLNPFPVTGDPLAVGIASLIAASLAAVVGGRLIGSSRCVLALRPPACRRALNSRGHS